MNFLFLKYSCHKKSRHLRISGDENYFFVFVTNFSRIACSHYYFADDEIAPFTIHLHQLKSDVCSSHAKLKYLLIKKNQLLFVPKVQKNQTRLNVVKIFLDHGRSI